MNLYFTIFSFSLIFSTVLLIIYIVFGKYRKIEYFSSDKKERKVRKIIKDINKEIINFGKFDPYYDNLRTLDKKIKNIQKNINSNFIIDNENNLLKQMKCNTNDDSFRFNYYLLNKNSTTYYNKSILFSVFKEIDRNKDSFVILPFGSYEFAFNVIFTLNTIPKNKLNYYNIRCFMYFEINNQMSDFPAKISYCKLDKNIIICRVISQVNFMQLLEEKEYLVIKWHIRNPFENVSMTENDYFGQISTKHCEFSDGNINTFPGIFYNNFSVTCHQILYYRIKKRNDNLLEKLSKTRNSQLVTTFLKINSLIYSYLAINDISEKGDQFNNNVKTFENDSFNTFIINGNGTFEFTICFSIFYENDKYNDEILTFQKIFRIPGYASNTNSNSMMTIYINQKVIKISYFDITEEIECSNTQWNQYFIINHNDSFILIKNGEVIKVIPNFFNKYKKSVFIKKDENIQLFTNKDIYYITCFIFYRPLFKYEIDILRQFMTFYQIKNYFSKDNCKKSFSLLDSILKLIPQNHNQIGYCSKKQRYESIFISLLRLNFQLNRYKQENLNKKIDKTQQKKLLDQIKKVEADFLNLIQDTPENEILTCFSFDENQDKNENTIIIKAKIRDK